MKNSYETLEAFIRFGYNADLNVFITCWGNHLGNHFWNKYIGYRYDLQKLYKDMTIVHRKTFATYLDRNF